MKDSPETGRPGLRRAAPQRLARILAEGRPSRRRLLFLLAGAGLILWVVLANAVESSQALRFRLVDPWPAEQPALWMPAGGFPQRLEAAVSRLRVCLEEHRENATKAFAPTPSLAITPDPRLGPQGLYWSLWVISMWPEEDIRIVGADGDPGGPRFLIAGSPQKDLKLLCSAEPLRLYGLDGRVGEGEAR